MEEQKFRDARENLLTFTECTLPDYQVATHHALIAEHLEMVERGEIDRLMIQMPPRHGKSELASRRFPAWFLGRNPNRQVIASSCNSNLASDFGRDVRNIVRTNEYARCFSGVSLADDSKAANRWNTNKGGSYIAAGIGSVITGRGAHLALIDDPVKDRASADSQTIRDNIWDWYTSTLYTRLMPGGAIVVIQTRWHEDDLSGRLLNEEGLGGDQWVKLILPAYTEERGALWEGRYPKSALDRIKAAVGPRDWSALFQQDPTPDDGTFFQKDWFRRHSAIPPNCNIYGCSDYAVTDKGGDFTEHGVFAVDPEGDIYQLDWWHGQTSADEWIERKIDLIERYKPACWFGEGGVIQKAVEPMLTRRMRERRVYARIEWVSSVSDKATRARGFQARAAMSKVSLLADERGDRLFKQLVSFPAGKYDDAVDVCGLIGRVLDDAHPGLHPPKKAKSRNFYDYGPDREDDLDSWKVI